MDQSEVPDDKNEQIEVRLPIGGMHCLSCVLRIESALEDLPGVLAAEVDFADATAILLIRPATVTIDDLLRAVEAEGYRATLQ